MAKVQPETKIFEIFEAISKVSSLKEKVKLLKSAYEVDNNVFKQIAMLVFSKDKYNVNEQTIKLLKPGDKYTSSFKEFMILIDRLKRRDYQGRKGLIELLQIFYSKLDKFHAKWYSRILLKDLRIGAGYNLFSQVLSLDETYKVPSPMLAISADAFKENKLRELLENSDISIEIKIDGFRLITCIYDTHVECYTRNGKRVPYLEEIFFNDFKKLMEFKELPKPFIIDGEVFSKDWNLTMSFSPTRKTKLSKQQEESLRYYLFDYIHGDLKKYKNGDVVKVPYIKRLNILQRIFHKLTFKQFIFVHKVISKKDNRHEDVLQLVSKVTEKYLNDNWEGSVVKILDSYYYFGKRTKDWIKFKKFDTLDLLVVDVEPSTKRPNEIGALVVLYKGNKVRVSGLTDEQRKRWFKNPKEIIGKIIEVKHMGETKDKKLRHPNFVRVRHDKDIPDA